MNIERLRQILAGLPNVITPVQFGQIELEMEDLLAQQRQEDEAELAALQKREAELRLKLRLVTAPAMPVIPSRPTPPVVGDTDADNGVDYDETDSGMSLRDETSALRQRNVDRRRARGFN